LEGYVSFGVRAAVVQILLPGDWLLSYSNTRTQRVLTHSWRAAIHN